MVFSLAPKASNKSLPQISKMAVRITETVSYTHLDVYKRQIP